MGVVEDLLGIFLLPLLLLWLIPRYPDIPIWVVHDLEMSMRCRDGGLLSQLVLLLPGI